MAEKKKLTIKQKKNRARACQYLAFGGEFVSILTPFITLGIVNYKEWFTTEEGMKVGLGGALTLALMGIAVYLVTAKKEKKAEITDGWITFMVGWFMVAFIFFLFSSIMNQIFSIMMWGGLGLMGAFGLDIVSKKQKQKADAYKSALETAKTESLEEEARLELKKENDKKGLI